MEKARITGRILLEPIISDHILDESLKKRGSPLADLPREERRRILEERLIQSKVLKQDTEIYQKLIRGLSNQGKKRYYKIDPSPEYPYIYVVRKHKKHLKEIMITLYKIEEFGKGPLTRLGEFIP